MVLGYILNCSSLLELQLPEITVFRPVSDVTWTCEEFKNRYMEKEMYLIDIEECRRKYLFVVPKPLLIYFSYRCLLLSSFHYLYLYPIDQ